MITYEFVAKRIGLNPVFVSDRVTDQVEVPIELRFSHHQLRTEGLEVLQARIETAVQEMVDKLNAE